MIRTTKLSICIGLICCFSVGCRSVSRAPVTCDSGTCGLVQAGPKTLQSRLRVQRTATLKPVVPKVASDSRLAKSKVIQASYSNQDGGRLELEAPTETGSTELASRIVSANVPLSSTRHAVGAWRQSPLSSNALTLEQAEQFAIENNPDLVKAQAEIESLQGKRLQVGLKPNPQIGYLAADIGEEGTAGQQGGFFSQTFIRGGKLQLNRSIVCQEIEAAKHQLEINRQKLLTEVRQRFYDLLVAQERVNIANNFEALNQEAVSTSNKLFEEEEISQIANLRARIQFKNTQVVVEQAQNDLTAATRRFAAATGMGQPDSTQAGSISVIGDVFPQSDAPDPSGQFAEIIAASPELAQAAAELERAKWNLNRQIAEPTRNVQVQTGFTHSNVTGDDLVALQVGVPLRINDRNQGNIASARSEIAAQMKNIESIERDLSRRFSVAWRDYENARIQVSKYQNEIIPETSRFYEMVASAFKEGEIGYLDLVTAQQTYLDASLQNLTAVREFWRAASLIDGYLLSEN